MAAMRMVADIPHGAAGVRGNNTDPELKGSWWYVLHLVASQRIGSLTWFFSSAWETSQGWRGQQGRFYQHHLSKYSHQNCLMQGIRSGQWQIDWKLCREWGLGLRYMWEQGPGEPPVYIPGNLEDHPYMPRAGYIFRKGQEDTKMVTTQWPCRSMKAGSEG